MVLVLLILAACFDVKENRIPNILNATGLVMGFMVAIVHPEKKLLEALVGASVSFLVGFVCWILKAIRGGDAKLLCAAGSFLGWQMFLRCFFYAMLVAAIAGLPMVILKFLTKKKGQTEFPFALAVLAGYCFSFCHTIFPLISTVPT